MNDSDSLIHIVEALCGYQKKTILNNVNLSVRPGECWAVIGNNGEGKTTLLHSLMGLIPLRSGERSGSALNLENTGYVGQHAKCYYPLNSTVEGFIELGLVGHSHRGDMIRVVEAANQVGIKSLLAHQVSTLSGGQYQKAVLARSLVRNPNLIYLDEPTVGLDQRSKREFMKEIKTLCEKGSKAVLVVLHEFQYLAEDYTHIAWVHDKTVSTGPVQFWLEDQPFRKFVGF